MQHVQAIKEDATKTNSLKDYQAAEADERNTLHFMTPYAIGQDKAQSLKQQKYLLKAASGEWSEVGSSSDRCPRKRCGR